MFPLDTPYCSYLTSIKVETMLNFLDTKHLFTFEIDYIECFPSPK